MALWGAYAVGTVRYCRRNDLSSVRVGSATASFYCYGAYVQGDVEFFLRSDQTQQREDATAAAETKGTTTGGLDPGKAAAAGAAAATEERQRAAAGEEEEEAQGWRVQLLGDLPPCPCGECDLPCFSAKEEEEEKENKKQHHAGGKRLLSVKSPQTKRTQQQLKRQLCGTTQAKDEAPSPRQEKLKKQQKQREYQQQQYQQQRESRQTEEDTTAKTEQESPTTSALLLHPSRQLASVPSLAAQLESDHTHADATTFRLQNINNLEQQKAESHQQQRVQGQEHRKRASQQGGQLTSQHAQHPVELREGQRFFLKCGVSCEILSLPAKKSKQFPASAASAGRAAFVGDGVRTGERITVQYKGVLAAGLRKFDSGKIGFTVGRGEVIPGLEAGVIGMSVGERRRLLIPSSLAYGNRGAPPTIPPHADLIFEVTLVARNNARH
ncbi:UNVERIFIED_CONTAM: hypothetical protein H355_008954 [Colinus virginianus]|nr:hypothetical protein H355_008954 [Colinus virginianus]